MVDTKEPWVLIKTINLKVWGGVGVGLELTERRVVWKWVKHGRWVAAMRLYPLPFTNPSPQYPGFGFGRVANSQTVVSPYIGHLYSTTPDVDLALLCIYFLYNHYQKGGLAETRLHCS